MNHTAATGALHNGGVSRWITTYRYLCLQPARSATAKMDSTILPVIGGIHSGAAPPCFYVCGLFFVVINGGQAQQGGSRLGEGPAHRAASLHTLNKPKPLQQFESIAQSRRRNTQHLL